MEKTEEKIAKVLLSEGAVTLNPDEPFTYASGIRSPIYCDNRLLISNPQARELVIEAFCLAIKEQGLTNAVIAGTATAGIPWAAWIADKLQRPMIYVRSSAKGHGRQNQIEGKVTKGEDVIVIEDLISSGGSSVKAIEALQAEGMNVKSCLAIFTYEMKNATEAFQAIQIPLFTLSKFSALIEVAKELGNLSDEQCQTVLQWNQDPQKWSERFK
jgi:orotate phosphoribosyltransferase